MPKVNIVKSLKEVNISAVDKPIFSDQLDALPKKLLDFAKLMNFTGSLGETLLTQKGEIIQVLVGLGDSKSFNTKKMRTAAAAYSSACKPVESIATTMLLSSSDMDTDSAMSAVIEGILLVGYTFEEQKGSDYKKPVERKTVYVVSNNSTQPVANKANKTAQAVNLARDLGNQPGGYLTPEKFESIAESIAKKTGLNFESWNKSRIVKEKLGGLLAVNQGSHYEPRLVKLNYKPVKKPKAHIALVGKGITFDSGGLSLKTSKGMMKMKIDMAGGAAVLSAMSLLKDLKSDIEVTGFIPLTDNMTGSFAQRPGDVFTARNGKTVEVLNTDAEGRLILADGLSLAAELKPDAIIDIATLTGSCSVALGSDYAALMSNDNSAFKIVYDAAKIVDEKMWRLPLPTEYRKQLDSTVADIKNVSSSPFGGTLTAGLFLKEFVNSIPWVHIDLGVSAFSDTASGLNPKGANGLGVRTLAYALSHWN